MMSNCAFWSASGELLAVSGDEAEVARASFAVWAASLRLPAGRLVTLSPGFPVPPPPGPGWQTLSPRPVRPGKPPRVCPPDAPVAVAAPLLDTAASLLFPPAFQHEKFTLRSWPTWVSSVRLEREEGPEGWYAALEDAKTSRFLLRLVPHRSRLPGEGWRNMVAWALRSTGLRLVPLNGLPRAEALAVAPAWEYRVEAGRGADSAAWDVQVLPSRAWLREHAPGTNDPWEATALLRFARPGAPSPLLGLSNSSLAEPTWAALLGRWSPADARIVVQNFLNTLPGGAAAAAPLFFDALPLPAGPEGETLVRYVPQDGLPVALLSTLFGRRAWHEIERAKRRLPALGEVARLRSESLADLDLRLTEGRLVWSAEADALWNALYRLPMRRAQQARLRKIRQSQRWAAILAGDPRVPEALLRDLDVTDAALCLRDAPDTRWRRYVTARREAELREELEFIGLWDARGELTPERELEAWRAWDERAASLPLTEGRGGN